LGIFVLTYSTCFATNPLPPAVQQAIEKLQADTQAYAASSGSLAAAQAATAVAQAQLASVQAQVTALQAAIPQDQAAVAAAIAQAFGPVVPSPADAHPVQIIEIGSSTCEPCNEMDVVLKSVQATGVPVKRIDTDKDPAAKAWKVSVTPTFITTVDGAEVNRYEKGKLNEKQLVDWYADTRAWVAKKFPSK
jgi:hypothetical protein